MTLNEYQAEAMRTAPREFGSHALEMATFALGLTGEAGEVADHVKKHIGHGHPLDFNKIGKELGDVLWYVAKVADVFGFSLEMIAAMNVEKLRLRYPTGFSSEASIHRAESEGEGEE